jgi:hypothetical protein
VHQVTVWSSVDGYIRVKSVGRELFPLYNVFVLSFTVVEFKGIKIYQLNYVGI